MPRKCSICTHKKRNEIDLALTLKNDSIERIATQYKVTESSLKRHVKNNHLSDKAIKAVEVKDIKEAKSLFDKVKDLEDRAIKILDAAETSGTIRDMCSAIREVRETIKMMATLTGELKGDQPVVNIGIMIDPEKIIGTESYREYERRIYAEIAG
jgi:hypothetical protein